MCHLRLNTNMIVLRALILMLCLLAGQGAFAQKQTMTIFTASSKGTYFQFAENIVRACPKFNIQVVSTDGSLDNINQLLRKPSTKTGHRFAFVQNDALNSVLTSDPVVRSFVTPVMTMYREDIYVLVYKGAKIKSLMDLNGKRVSVGVPGSGVWFTANAIKTQLNLNWTPVERSPEESVLAVLVGDIDAMIAVGGSPIGVFKEMGAFVKGHVSLLSMSEAQLNGLYESSKLPGGTYLWQDNVVELRSTRSSFVAAADVPSNTVQQLTRCISENLPELRRWGHPKWNDVQPPRLKK